MSSQKNKARRAIDNPENVEMPEVPLDKCDNPYSITDDLLYRKLCQVLGFSYPQRYSVEDLKGLIKQSYTGVNEEEGLSLLEEVDRCVALAPAVNSQETFNRFFSKDLSQVMKLENVHVYAVDTDMEMNLVEKAYHLRDIKIEKGLINIILPDEDHRRHAKDKTLPIQAKILPSARHHHVTEETKKPSSSKRSEVPKSADHPHHR